MLPLFPTRVTVTVDINKGLQCRLDILFSAPTDGPDLANVFPPVRNDSGVVASFGNRKAVIGSAPELSMSA